MKQKNQNPAGVIDEFELEHSRGFDFKGFLKRVISRWSLNQQIGGGYALAIGIALLGMGTGIIVADIYHKQALVKLENADAVEYELRQLQISLIRA